MQWHYHHPRAQDLLGFIPQFLQEADPRSAREQFDDAYAHGGGWVPFQGFHFNPQDRSITYPGDPKYLPAASAALRDELILVYPHAWVAIVQKDGAVEIARMD